MVEQNAVHIRPLEPEDIDFLYTLENDESLWEISETLLPYSRHILKNYIENAHQDIYQAKQYRWVIDLGGTAIGCIDLYNFDVKNQRAGIGIAVLEAYRGQGFGLQALSLLCEYQKKHLPLHQLYAYISESNIQSQRLFEKIGFKKTSERKDWLWNGKNFENQYIYQKIV